MSTGVIDQQFPKRKEINDTLVCRHSSCSLCNINTVEIHSSLATLWYTSGVCTLFKIHHAFYVYSQKMVLMLQICIGDFVRY